MHYYLPLGSVSLATGGPVFHAITTVSLNSANPADRNHHTYWGKKGERVEVERRIWNIRRLLHTQDHNHEQAGQPPILGTYMLDSTISPRLCSECCRMGIAPYFTVSPAYHKIGSMVKVKGRLLLPLPYLPQDHVWVQNMPRILKGGGRNGLWNEGKGHRKTCCGEGLLLRARRSDPALDTHLLAAL